MKCKLLSFFLLLSISVYSQENNVKLNSPYTIPFTYLFDFQMNSDYVVYLSDHEQYGINELYSVPINGGASTKLNPPLDAELGKVENYAVVDNQVYYTTRLDFVKNTSDLYVVPITGGTSKQLNPPLGDFGGVISFNVIENQIVYMADEVLDGKVELFQLDLSDGTVVKLNHTLKDREKVVDFIVQDDWIAYRTEDRTAITLYELYSVPFGGGTTNKLNGPLVDFGDVHPNYQISNGFVIYLADQDINGTDELYSTPITGGTVTKLNLPFSTGKDVSAFQSKNETIIYLADQDIDGLNELYKVSIKGGESTKLHPDLIIGMGVDTDFQIVGETLFYRAIQEDNFYKNKLYKVPISGGEVTLLSPPLPTFGKVYNFKVFDNSIIYAANQADENALEFYSMPLTGGESIKLNPTLFNGDRILDQYDKVGGKIVYIAFQESDFRELFSVDCPSISYAPLAVENATWIQYSAPDGFDNITYFAYKVQGDTVIQSVTYKKMYYYDLFALGNGRFELINQKLMLAIRDDTANRKVFGINLPINPSFDNPEYLMLDFNQKIGEAFDVFRREDENYPSKIKTDTIDFRFGQFRRLLKDEEEIELIEGIGYEDGLFFTPTKITHAGFGYGLVDYCRDLNFNCNILTAINAPLPQKVDLYPNPVNDQLNIQFTQSFSGMVQLMSAAGQALYVAEFKGLTHTINLVDFPKGVYFLRLQSEEGYLVKKIIVQ